MPPDGYILRACRLTLASLQAAIDLPLEASLDPEKRPAAETESYIPVYSVAEEK